MQISLLMYLLMVATSVFFLGMAEFFKRQGEKYHTSKYDARRRISLICGLGLMAFCCVAIIGTGEWVAGADE